MADPASQRNDRAGLEFSGRTFPRLRARPRGWSAVALHRAQFRAGSDRIHPAEYSRIQYLDRDPQHGAGSQSRTKHAGGMEVAGAGALRPCLFGLEMNATAIFGPELHPDGVRFRLWAPAARRVELMLDRAHPMQASGAGWSEQSIPGAGAGILYKFRIDGELEVPDPAPHFQPA